MLMALLKGKLSREQENMEDILTSSVFGLLQYLPPEVALLPLLRLARTPEGARPLADLPDGTLAEYEFWPQWDKGGGASCEPDLVLRLALPDGSRKLVLIEAKFHSAKSVGAEHEERAPLNDQLAREWDNLTLYAREEGAGPLLVYLTAHMGCPSEAIEASRAEHRRKRGGEATIAWLSWRHLGTLLTDAPDRLLRDLGQMLRKLSLVFFTGFSEVAPPAPVAWRFECAPFRFEWRIALIPGLPWRFRPRNTVYDWQVRLVGPISWRFVA